MPAKRRNNPGCIGGLFKLVFDILFLPFRIIFGQTKGMKDTGAGYETASQRAARKRRNRR